MPARTSEADAREVLRRYPHLWPLSALTHWGNRGGFSGAEIWQVNSGTDRYCLKFWPPGSMTCERLAWIHDLMNRAVDAGLTFVPRPAVAADGRSCVLLGDGLWDVCAWMPGKADFRDRPTPTRLTAACTGLARLHRVWAQNSSPAACLPAIQRRRERLAEWTRLLQSGWQPHFRADGTDPVQPWARRAWRMLQIHTRRIEPVLEQHAQRVLPLQPCLADVWHDHVLLEGDRLTGLIDHGGVRTDHVSVDLARLLGSLAEDSATLRAAGLEAYQRVRALSPQEEALVSVLDVTGTVLGAANWLRWLYAEDRPYEDRDAVARRLASLVRRMERWT